MQVTRFPDPRSFLESAEPFLLRAEAENNLMLGIAGMASSLGEDAYLATVEDGGAIVTCALRTPPYKAVISRADAPAIVHLVADLAEKYPELAQVHGPEPAAFYFADLWAQRTGVPSIQGTKHRLFEIRETPHVAAPPGGRLRLAAERDLPTIIAWSAAFIAEALPGDPTDPEKHAMNRSLYTDLSNPTSNSIYQKIGYRPIGDSSDYVLNSRKAVSIR